jgi:hypothetical protein
MNDVPGGSIAAKLHQPVEPGGGCRVCKALWPCVAKRAELLAEFHDDQISLLIYMSLHLVEALDRNPIGMAAAQFYERYLGWVPWPDGASDDSPVVPPADRSAYAGGGDGSRHEAHAT